MQYAGYYNLKMADNAARKSESRRSSANTQSSTSEQKPKSTFKKIIDQLKATDDNITPSGIYTPIIKQGPLFSHNSSKQRGSTSSVSSVSSSESNLKA